MISETPSDRSSCASYNIRVRRNVIVDPASFAIHARQRNFNASVPRAPLYGDPETGLEIVRAATGRRPLAPRPAAHTRPKLILPFVFNVENAKRQFYERQLLFRLCVPRPRSKTKSTRYTVADTRVCTSSRFTRKRNNRVRGSDNAICDRTIRLFFFNAVIYYNCSAAFLRSRDRKRVAGKTGETMTK